MFPVGNVVNKERCESFASESRGKNSPVCGVADIGQAVPMRRVIPFVLLTLLSSCGGASLVLRGPVASQCKDAALKDCDNIADGVLGYVEGSEKEKKKLATAAAANDPVALAKFSGNLRALAKAPGAGSYASQLEEVASVLDKGGSSSSSTSDVAASGPTPNPTSNTTSSRGTTATVIPPGHPAAYACSPLGKTTTSFAGASCVRLAVGPLVVTDLTLGPACPADVFVTAGPIDSPTWLVSAGPKERIDLHGAHYVVGKSEELVVATKSAGTLTRDIACAVTWSGQ